jgi:hypothetical protein
MANHCAASIVSRQFRFVFMAVRARMETSRKKKQGATGITTVAPYIAGQWGRGE